MTSNREGLKAESKILHSERVLLQRAISASRNGITIGRAIDGKFPLIYANAAFTRLTGYAHDEVMGMDCRFLQQDMTDQEELDRLRAALANGMEATVLLSNFRKDGTHFWNELTVSPVLDDSGEVTHFVGLQYDVTDRVNDIRAIAELNRTLARRSDELEQANESVRSFSYSASHDLSAPLSSIKGFCAALRKSADLEPESNSAHYVARIEANADRMQKLIDALLDLAQSSARPLKQSMCDLSNLAREVVDAFFAGSPDLRAQVTIESNLQAWGDAALLQSVLQNLLGNALKYSSKNPSATVYFGHETDAAGTERFFVRDNGAGFDMKYASNLFGTFERLHSEAEYPGTGVGLATVRRIITRHGGTVWGESAPGAGAVFYFTLASDKT